VVVSDTPLVGRHQETAVLDAALDGIRGDGPRFLLVAGDPGIGKSRLLAELSARARDRGLAVGAARALEAVRASPNELLATAVEPVLGVPLDELLPDTEGAGDGEGDQTRREFFARVADGLAESAERSDIVLILDDLHWADAPTLRFVESLARSGPTPGLVIAGAYRPAAVRRGEPLTRLLAVLGETGATARIDLAGLAPDEVAELAATTLGHPLTREALADLVNETEGNPLFTLEIARTFDLASPADGSHRPPPLPSAVRASVFARLDALPAAASDTLAAAAVLGGTFDLSVLATMVGRPAAELLGDLAPAERAGLVEPSEDPGWSSFTHPLICRVIYEGLTSDERATRHLEAARAIGVASPTHGASRLAALAYHHARASAVGGLAPAIHHARLAGDHARARLAFEDAIRFYGDALEMGERVADDDPAERCEVMLSLADALVGAGETMDGRIAYADAAGLAVATGDTDRLARGALGRAGYRGTPGAPDLDAIALLEQAMANPAEDPLLRARVGARQAMELYYLGERERRDELSSTAVALARREAAPTVLAQVLISRHYALDEVDNVVEREAVAAEAARLAEANGDGDTAMRAHYLLVRDRLELGDRTGADAATERHRVLAEQAREPLYPWRVLLLDGLFAHLDGDLERAERLAAEAHAFGTAAALPNAEPARGGLLFLVFHEQGRLGELVEFARDGLARYPGLSTWGPYLACCLLDAGDPVSARQVFDTAMTGLDGLSEDETFLPTGFTLALLAVALGDLPAAEVLFDRYRTYASRAVVVVGPTGCAGPVALFLGQLALALGRPDEAGALLDQAAAVADSLRSPLWRAHVDRATAELDTRGPRHPAGLTDREAEVLGLVAAGLTNREVAARLHLGVRTIDSHLTAIYRKVGARRRGDAVAFAVANGLAETNP
jgi:DNA-binding CsgD family transcriptional regulator